MRSIGLRKERMSSRETEYLLRPPIKRQMLFSAVTYLDEGLSLEALLTLEVDLLHSWK
jgi:hypothetical protein